MSIRDIGGSQDSKRAHRAQGAQEAAQTQAERKTQEMRPDAGTQRLEKEKEVKAHTGPSLVPPKGGMSKERFERIAKEINPKLTTNTLDPESMRAVLEKERVNSDILGAQTYREIQKIVITHSDPTKRFMAIAKIFAELGHLQIKAYAEYLSIMDKQLDIQALKKIDTVKEQVDLAEQRKHGKNMERVWRWIGGIGSVVAGAVLLTVTSVLTGATAGAASPGVVGAGAFMASSCLTLGLLIAEESGLTEKLMKDVLEPWFASMGAENPKMAAQIFFTSTVIVTQIIIAVASMGMLSSSAANMAGATAADLATAFQRANEALANSITKIAIGTLVNLNMVAEAGLGVYSAKLGVDVAHVEKDQLMIQKIVETLRFYMDNASKLSLDVSKHMSKITQDASGIIREHFSSTLGIINKASV